MARARLPRSLLTAFLLASLSPVGAQEPQFAVNWILDVDSGFELARERRQAALIDFYADWCGPCRRMDETVWTDESVGNAANRAVLVRVDFDEERKLVRRYKVDAVPTMVFVDPWGVEIGRIVGSLSSTAMIQRFEALPGNFAAVSQFQERAERDENDAEAYVRIGAFYRTAGLLAGADFYYERAIDASGKGKRDPAAAAEALLGLGLNDLERELYKDAAKHLEECVKKFQGTTSHAHALYGLVLARVKQKDLKKARKEFERLSSEYPDYPALEDAERALSEES